MPQSRIIISYALLEKLLKLPADVKIGGSGPINPFLNIAPDTGYLEVSGESVPDVPYCVACYRRTETLEKGVEFDKFEVENV
jgi:hypothetical protein